MGHNEDEQPNESVLGRPKRVMPFVTNTSRGRGRGGGRGNHAFTERGRGRGRGFNHAVSIVPGSSRGGHFQALSGAPSSSGHSAFPHQHPIPPCASGIQVSDAQISGDRLSQKPPVTPMVDLSTKEPSDQPIAFAEDPTPTPSSSKRPRPRKRGFRPGRGKFQKGAVPQRPDTLDSSAWEARSDNQSQPGDNPSHDANEPPPAKRPRLDEDPSSSHVSPAENTPLTGVKSEDVDEPPTSSLQEQATSGSKFISYDRYPMCRFNCGRPPAEVRNNRKSAKGQEVLDLLKQGLKVDAAFIRDDGIAIDWSLPTETKAKISVPPTAPPPTLVEPELNVSLATPIPVSSHGTNPPSQPLQKTLPSHVDPLATPAYNPTSQSPDTPTLAETTYRQVQIPSRHLPRRGDTRKLEIWVLEQMRLLEAELGSVLIPPPELIGVGEYIRGQALPNGVAPCVRIHYKRPIRASGGSKRGSQQGDRHGSDVALPEQHDTPLLQNYDSTPTPSDPSEPALPPIAHLAQSPSPSPAPPSILPIVKHELDGLKLDPPSPLAEPGPALPVPMVAEPALLLPDLSDPIQTHPSEKALGKRPASTNNDPSVEPASVTSGEELDEIQRLRADLEKSRLEAEQKHRDLERRIRELSKQSLSSDSSDVGVVAYNAPRANDSVRIVDDTKSKLLVLRRGKHDKTRRLLSFSSSNILHISWLGVMQMVNKDTRQIVASGFEEGAPDSISVEDACMLSQSSVALALTGSGSQLGIATLGKESFKLLPLSVQAHEARGVCTITAVNPSSVITLGHDHRYVHWQLDKEGYATTPLPIHKLHQCTALAFEPVSSSVITAGSDSGKNGKLTLYGLGDSQHTYTTVDLSNHVHHIHTDSQNPSLLVLELARLDDQFQVHDMRLPLYQCVQKFGYQNSVHERGGFRTRGSTRGHFFARGDIGIVRSWDRRHLSSYQTTQVVPSQKVVEVILDSSSLVCATESHHITSYPLF